MKIYLDEVKYLDLNIKNWNTEVNDYELETLRNLFAEYVSILGEMPVFNPSTGLYNMTAIIENEYVFNNALRYFGLIFNLSVEFPEYMLKDINEEITKPLMKDINNPILEKKTTPNKVMNKLKIKK